MDLYVHLVRFDVPGGPPAIARSVADVGRACDEAGVVGLTVMDHFFQIRGMGPPEDPMLEGYTTLGYLASQTQRITLGLLVTGVTYRHPGLLAKTVATLDVLSDGRAELGIGAAWNEEEHVGLGVPFPPVAERFERLEEALQICRQMWSGEDKPYDGKHYQLARTLCVPPPLHRPRIVIGGTGERKTLHLVAQYADACNLFGQSPEFVAGKLDVLRRHCDDVGRDEADITKTILYIGDALSSGDTTRFLADMATYAECGITEVHVMPPQQSPAEWVGKVCGAVTKPLADIR